MADIEMLRPYIVQKLGEVLGVDDVATDADGDIPIRTGSAISVMRLLNGPTGPMVRFFAPLLSGVNKTPELLERLNDLNGKAPYVRFFHAGDVVFCGLDVFAENLQPEEIASALRAISVHADQLDDLLKGEFGGRRMVEDEDVVKPSQAESGYL